MAAQFFETAETQIPDLKLKLSQVRMNTYVCIIWTHIYVFIYDISMGCVYVSKYHIHIYILQFFETTETQILNSKSKISQVRMGIRR